MKLKKYLQVCMKYLSEFERFTRNRTYSVSLFYIVVGHSVPSFSLSASFLAPLERLVLSMLEKGLKQLKIQEGPRPHQGMIKNYKIQ